MTVSPITISSAGTVTSRPSRRTRALSGARRSRAEMAPVVFLRERCSKYLPTVTRVRIMPADSKYRSGMPSIRPAMSKPISMRLYTRPAAAPKATRESILELTRNSLENPTVK